MCCRIKYSVLERNSCSKWAGRVRLAEKEIETKGGKSGQTNKQATVTKDKQICLENTPSNVKTQILKIVSL